MTISDRIHRNARMILEAADRYSDKRGAFAIWDLDDNVHLVLEREGRRMRWRVAGSMPRLGGFTITRNAAATIFDGLL